MNISFDYYKIFYFVAKYGSFSKAAEALFNNQPNLTRAIKTLESELGCTLFIRSNKGVKLTPSGEILFEHVSVAYEHICAGEEEISFSKSLENGVVSIGASEIALRCFLLPILNKFHHQYPGINMKITNHSTPQALKRLKDGLVDLAVITSPMEVAEDIKVTAVKEFEEVAVCGEDYRALCEKNTLTLEDLVQYSFVSLGEKTSTYRFYFQLFMKHGLSFSADIEAATADQVLPLVQHNMGIGFVPEAFLSEAPMNGIYRLPLKTPLPKRGILLVKKRFDTLSLPAKELERMILAAGDAVAAQPKAHL